jgi:MFS superfamily sulfate permease-like transporter
VGLFFILSGIGKIIDSSLAEKAIWYTTTDFHSMLPDNPRTLAIGFSLIEIIIGCLYLWGKSLIPILLFSCGILLSYILTLGDVVIKAKDVPACACFGAFEFGLSPLLASIINFTLYCILTWMTFFLQKKSKRYQGLFVR